MRWSRHTSARPCGTPGARGRLAPSTSRPKKNSPRPESLGLQCLLPVTTAAIISWNNTMLSRLILDVQTTLDGVPTHAAPRSRDTDAAHPQASDHVEAS